MSVTPKVLSRGISFAQNIEPVIRENLQMIDAKLTNANRRIGWNVVAVDVETNFAVLRSIPRADGQALVYSGIISSLEDRGFVVRTVIDDTKALFLIGYEIALPQDQLDNLYRVVKKSRLAGQPAISSFRSGEVRDRITVGTAAAPTVPRATRPDEDTGGHSRRERHHDPPSPRGEPARPQSPPGNA